MTIYDAAMAIVVVLGMVRGAWRGFTWQIASIASLVLGYTAGHTVSGRLAPYLPGEPEVQRMLAMGVVYIAVSGGIFGIAWMIRGTLRKLKFEAFASQEWLRNRPGALVHALAGRDPDRALERNTAHNMPLEQGKQDR